MSAFCPRADTSFTTGRCVNVQPRCHLHAEPIQDQTQKEKFLLRIIAAQAIVQQFESTYRAIWGSQLNALEITNATPGGVQLGVFETLYNQAAARDKAQYANYSFKQWLAYMESQLLVIRKDDKIYINLDGREFLKYIIHQGYTMYKYW